MLHLCDLHFSSVEDLATWRPLEEAKWRAVPKLGPEWMCKWSVDERGYQVMVTDGSTLWGEARTARYIQDKAEVRLRGEIFFFPKFRKAKSSLITWY